MSGYATRIALRELGRRVQFLDAQLDRLDELIIPLVTTRAPGLLSLHQVGPLNARRCCWSPPDWSILSGCAAKARGRTCAAPPRSRPPRGRPAGTGSTAAATARPTSALWRIVITRLSSHPATRAYAERRSKEGLSKKEIIRCLKRYVAREVYRQLRARRADTRSFPGAAWPSISAAAPAGLRSIRRPSPGTPSPAC